MLNKNGKALLKINNSYDRAVTTMQLTDGTTYQYGANSNQLGKFNQNLKLYVGSGTTDATVDDYCLESEDSALTVVSRSGTNDSSASTYTQNYIAVFSATFINNTDADVTVSEVGIIGEDASSKRAMIARDLLDEPRTIQPGKTYTFSMTIG